MTSTIAYNNKQKKQKKPINIVGLSIIEQYYETEIKELKELYNKKHYQLEKATQENNEGLTIILENEVHAIKRALIAGAMLKNGYLEYLNNCAEELKAAKQDNKELKGHLRTLLIDTNLKTSIETISYE